jgi:dTMP kinase
MIGRFIVLEGLDGAGTTTQGQRLVAHLNATGRPAELHAEPTSGPLGRVIRQVLRGELSLGGPERERIVALLFAADRLDHVGGHVEPALQAGRHVVSDRYLPSSLAYQSVFCDPAWVATLNRHARTPDLTLFLDVSPEVGLARVAARTGTRERYEVLETLTRVHAGYQRWLQGPHAHRVEVLDGTRPIDELQATIAGLVDGLLSAPTSVA